MFEILQLKPKTFGLDISDRSLKIAKLGIKKDFISLLSFGEEKIPSGVIIEGEIKNEKALADIIRSVLDKVQGERLDTRYAIVSLPEEKAFLKIIQMPKMESDDLEGAIKFEAENYIPMPISDVYLDFQIITPLKDHLDHLDILLAALPKKVVDPYLSALKQAGVRVKALEIESLAISRAIVKNEASPAPVLLIDFGETRTSFIVFSGYTLRFTSSIPVSSSKFTEAISKTLKVGLDEAEKLKIEKGLIIDSKSDGRAIFEALIPSLTDLLEQIKAHIRYYQTHALHEHLLTSEKNISKIIFSGGGASLKGLSDFLAIELKTPVEMGNPWINILPSPLKEVPILSFDKSLGYVTALGLALREIKKPKNKLYK